MTASTDTPQSQLPSFVLSIASSFLRHGLTVAAGALAADGAIQKDQTTQFVAVGMSVGLWATALLWSYVEKRLNHSAAVAAVVDAKAGQ